MKKDVYELTNPQKSIYLTEQYYSGTTINNICGTSIINSTLDFELLKTAINIVIKNKIGLSFFIPKLYHENLCILMNKSC